MMRIIALPSSEGPGPAKGIGARHPGITMPGMHASVTGARGKTAHARAMLREAAAARKEGHSCLREVESAGPVVAQFRQPDSRREIPRGVRPPSE